MAGPLYLRAQHFDNNLVLTLTFPQITARSVTSALTAYYPENIIFKALINMYNSLTSLKERAALSSTAQLQYHEERMVMKCHIEFGHYVETLELPGSVGFIT